MVGKRRGCGGLMIGCVVARWLFIRTRAVHLSCWFESTEGVQCINQLCFFVNSIRTKLSLQKRCLMDTPSSIEPGNEASRLRQTDFNCQVGILISFHTFIIDGSKVHISLCNDECFQMEIRGMGRKM